MQGLRDKGYTLQDNEAEQLVSHLDVDFSGDVDYLDWLAAMIDWHKVTHVAQLSEWATNSSVPFYQHGMTSHMEDSMCANETHNMI